MRKKFNVIVCIMIVVCVMAFAVACVEKDADGLIKLSTPSNLALNGSVLSWDEVDNAKEYFISIDGNEQSQSVTTTTCDLSTMVTEYGKFSVAVRAYGDGEKYGTSDKSSPIEYHRGIALDTPDVKINGKVASWEAIDMAVNYSIKVTDDKGKVLHEFTNEALTYNFEDKKVDDQEDKLLYGEFGAYRISVIANPAEDNIKYSPSLAGTATYYNSTVLATPEFTGITGTTIRWGAVTNATNYTLRCTYDDGTFEEAQVSGTSYAYRTKFNLDKVGKYSFTIKANGDNQVYYSSEFNQEKDDYVVTKLEAVAPTDIEMKYDEKGVAKLSWKLPADSLATQFTLNLSALLPDGSIKLESSVLQKIISNKITYVVGNKYDFYKYDTDGASIVPQDGKTILVYNYDGSTKVRYNGEDYFLTDKEGEKVMWADYDSASAGKDIINVICDDSDGIKFVYEKKQYNDPNEGVKHQDTGETEDILGSDGNQLFFFETMKNDSDIEVIKGVEDKDGILYHTFELIVDDVFFKAKKDGDTTTYDYLISDNAYYGILYDVSISADNDSTNFVESQSTKTVGQYLSYKIPQKKDGKYIVTNTGEYAYIVLNSYINPDNTDEFSIEDNINFNGYEIVQINTFGGVIDGNKHTVSGIVVGNKIMTENGVVENDGGEINYSMFVNIDGKGNQDKGLIQNIFFVGMSYVGYDKEKLDESITSINVAPIAINNKGIIRDVLVQSDFIKAEGAQVAGMVINNYGYINNASVYANLEGMTVGGIMINNEADTVVGYVGFYGKITATLSDILTDGVTSVSGAGFVVKNNGVIGSSFAIGDVSVEAKGLDGVYAGGFVAVNNGTITQSYSGQFTLNNAVVTTVVAHGDNGYAGGFAGVNNGNITSSYATNKATASLYVGGFVGNNSNMITSCYSTGGTTNSGTNKGAFVGNNAGSIDKSACYSADSWAKDSAVEVFTSNDDLAKIVDVLYDGDEGMVMIDGKRNPLIKNLIYLDNQRNDNIVTVRPNQDVEIKGVVFANGELKDAEASTYGDNTKKGNRIVVELRADGVSQPRYIYGYIN